MNPVGSRCHFGGVAVQLAVCSCAQHYPVFLSKTVLSFYLDQKLNGFVLFDFGASGQTLLFAS